MPPSRLTPFPVMPSSSSNPVTRPFRRCLAALLLVTVFVGHARAQQPSVRVPSASSVPPPAAMSVAPPANYLLTANDLVQIKVFQEDDMNWTVRVTKDGSVVLPLVGTVAVARKTPDDLAAAVRERLLDGWLVHPQVSVTVLEFSKRRFTILGQVEKAGQIDFPDNATLNLLQAVGMAGGFTKNADPGRVYVKRTVGSKQLVLKVDARRMQRDARAEPFDILPGDTITVAETLF